MSKLTREDVLKLAQLARLHLSDSEVEQFTAEIQAILQHIEQLHPANLENVEPTYQVTGLKNVMRLDVVKDYGETPEELLKNAPQTENGHIKVRRVIE